MYPDHGFKALCGAQTNWTRGKDYLNDIKAGLRFICSYENARGISALSLWVEISRQTAPTFTDSIEYIKLTLLWLSFLMAHRTMISLFKGIWCLYDGEHHVPHRIEYVECFYCNQCSLLRKGVRKRKHFMQSKQVCVFLLVLSLQRISIPRSENSNELQTFSFYLSNVGRDNPQGSFDCIQQYITRWGEATCGKFLFLQTDIHLLFAPVMAATTQQTNSLREKPVVGFAQ